MANQVVLLDGPALKFVGGCIKLPQAWNGVSAELLPTEAMRRVPGNPTLYSVTYRRPENQSAEEKTANRDISGPFIVTVYQSDIRAKRFHTLVKMRVNVRLPADESYRFGVAVAVDEVDECVFVAYTRDEQTRSGSQRRLLLRRVQLTLAAADVRGVRRLQRPSSGRPSSVTFEARNYCKGAAVASSASRQPRRKNDARVAIQQLVLDGAALFLYLRIGHGLSYRGSFKLEGATSAVAQLKLRKKSASMDVRIRAPLYDNLFRGVGQHTLVKVDYSKSPQYFHEMRGAECLPYTFMPSLVNLGAVEDAASQYVDCSAESALRLIGHYVSAWAPFGSHARWKLIYCTYGEEYTQAVVAVRGLGDVVQHNVVAVQLVQVAGALAEWCNRYPPASCASGFFNLIQADGPFLLASSYDTQGPSAIVLRANLRSLLPPKTACANCHVAIRPSPPDKKKVCSVCRAMGFGQYSWVFGCHFCSAACLRDAWPKHSRLHRMPPLKDWTGDDWKRWNRDRPRLK